MTNSFYFTLGYFHRKRMKIDKGSNNFIKQVFKANISLTCSKLCCLCLTQLEKCQNCHRENIRFINSFFCINILGLGLLHENNSLLTIFKLIILDLTCMKHDNKEATVKLLLNF